MATPVSNNKKFYRPPPSKAQCVLSDHVHQAILLIPPPPKIPHIFEMFVLKLSVTFPVYCQIVYEVRVFNIYSPLLSTHHLRSKVSLLNSRYLLRRALQKPTSYYLLSYVCYDDLLNKTFVSYNEPINTFPLM